MTVDDGRRGLSLTDTLSRTKVAFAPLDWRDPAIPEAERRVRMYVCGPTVYDFAHIGNARPVIVFDVLFRLLRHLYGESHVTYVRNITDVDDKINARAARDHPGLPLNEAIAKVTQATAAQFHADVAALGCLPPSHEPRATAFVTRRSDGGPDMVSMIETLIAKGHAYEAAGEVLFDISSMPRYGALSRRRLDEQQAGARVAVEAHKRNPADFVLWKLSSDGEPGWDSPWGRGRPGWHIECSVMAQAYLGPVFDIHGGGLDLIFPHHENEIAQSCCAHDTDRMAEIWMHNGFLQVEGRKMSKSDGNFFTIADVLQSEKVGGRRWPGEAVRLMMMRTHYREPLDFTAAKLEEAERLLTRWYRMIAEMPEVKPSKPRSTFLKSLCDDLNIGEALSDLYSMFTSSQAGALEVGASELGWDFYDPTDAATALASARFLGLLNEDPLVWLRGEARLDEGLDARIAERLILLKARDFGAADAIREELSARGVQLKDGKDPATGERVTTWEIRR